MSLLSLLAGSLSFGLNHTKILIDNHVLHLSFYACGVATYPYICYMLYSRRCLHFLYFTFKYKQGKNRQEEEGESSKS